MDQRLLLDEHASRVLERVLAERGIDVVHAKDEFGEQTTDSELLEWCARNDVPILTNNAKDFESLHEEVDHAGIFIFYRQSLQDSDPEGLARTVEVVFEQYDRSGLANQVVDLDAWHDWLHE